MMRMMAVGAGSVRLRRLSGKTAAENQMAAITWLSFATVFLFLTCSAAAGGDSKIFEVTEGPRVVGRTERRFQAFMRRYGKTYDSREEYARRLAVFVGNLARAVEHQALDPMAKHGVTPFSDLTAEEFVARFMGLAAQPEREMARGRGHEIPPCSKTYGFPIYCTGLVPVDRRRRSASEIETLASKGRRGRRRRRQSSTHRRLI